MANYLSFALTIAALLTVPGPTNTLLAASGAAAGFSRSAKLIWAELSGYLSAIAFYSLVLGSTVGENPTFAAGIKLFASAYLVLSAVRLWRDAGGELASVATPVSVGRLFAATMLNPKALVFAFVVFPPVGLFEALPYAGLFALLVVVIGSGWIALGGFIALSVGLATPKRISRLAAMGLGIFATLIASSALAGF